jgi:hypothetical protein
MADWRIRPSSRVFLERELAVIAMRETTDAMHHIMTARARRCKWWRGRQSQFARHKLGLAAGVAAAGAGIAAWTHYIHPTQLSSVATGSADKGKTALA